MLIAVDEESLINSDIANKRKRIMDGQLIDKLGRRIEQQQAEIGRIRNLLKQCIPAAEFAKDRGLVDMINTALGEKHVKKI